MAQNDALARQSLKTKLLDHSHSHSPSHLNEKKAIQRKNDGHSNSTPSGNHKFIPSENNTYPEPISLGHDSIFAEQTLNLKKVLIWLAAYLGVGAFFFFLVRDHIKGKKTNGFLDAIYFCVVTMTTVGYGDLVPDSALSKVLASIYVFTGMALGGLILSKAADYILEKQEVLLVKALCGKESAGVTEMLREAEIHKTKYKFMVAGIQILVLAIVGTVFFCIVEKLSFVDAVYCVCSTITTLGYGDLSFSDGVGRLFGVFWILTGTISLAQFFLYLAELYTENRQKLLVNWVLSRRLTSSDLEAADLDNDKVVSAAEFVLYKLKEMGKINQADVVLVMQRFKNLDVDRSGTLTASDLTQSQLSQARD